MSAFCGPGREWLETRRFSREAGATPFEPIKSLSQKATSNTACFGALRFWNAALPIFILPFSISIPDFYMQVASDSSIPPVRSPQGPLLLGGCFTLTKEAKGPDGEARTGSCSASADPENYFSFGKYLNRMPLYLNEPTPNATRDFNLKRFPNCSKGKHV